MPLCIQNEKITLEIKGKLAEMLISLDEQRYKDFLVSENGETIILYSSDESTFWNAPSITFILSKAEKRS
jgi:hypothetical protein